MAKKKILIIEGHPDKNSFSSALAAAYETGAKTHHNLKKVVVRDLKFDRDFKNQTKLEGDIKKAQTSLKWADHIVIFTPVWWGGVPPLLRSFIDRVLLAGFAYKYGKNGIPHGLLKGSVRVIYTQGSPFWFAVLIYRDAFWRVLKQLTLGFCGLSPVRRTVFSSIHKTTATQREQILDTVKELGRLGK